MTIHDHPCAVASDRENGEARPVRIVGGGLAGLALGVALRRSGVPVVIHEAGRYPRHRVCGEFLSGLTAADIGALGLENVFAAVPRHQTTAWFRGDRLLLDRELPEPALAISRYELDAAMAQRFEALGGVLRCGERIPIPHGGEGWIGATGRAKRPGQWLGLKAHFLGLSLRAGLEMHLGRGGYAGLTQLTDGRVNVCALLPARSDAGAVAQQHRMAGSMDAWSFNPRKARASTLGSAESASHAEARLPVDKSSLLATRLEAIGLQGLAGRLRAASCDPESVTGVTHFSFGWHTAGHAGPALGDRMALIPPFTGHGMTMALQGALTTAPWLEAWSRRRIEWAAAQIAAQTAVRCRFAGRLRWAAALHPFLLRPTGQAVVATLARTRLLPFTWLFHRLR